MSEHETPNSQTPRENKDVAEIFEGTLFLSPNVDYFQNGDDFFVYHNTYGYILKMSEDLVDFLEFFYPEPKSAAQLKEQFGQVFDYDTLNEFLSIFRTLACLLPDDQYEPQKTHDMYPTQARWITADQTDPQNVILYAFDNQSQDTILKLSLDAWESSLWLKIKGDKSVGELAEIIAQEDGLLPRDVEKRIAGTLALWSHHSIQAVKLSAEPCANFKGRRFGIPPYLISTMPYEKVTGHVRTHVDEQGNITGRWQEPPRHTPKSLEIIKIDKETLALDKHCARLSYLLENPHEVLSNRPYAKALFDVLAKYVPITGSSCRILEVGGDQLNAIQTLIQAAHADYPHTKIDYTLFCTNQDAARRMRAQNPDANIHIVDGDIEEIANILDGQKFDIIFSDEFIANLPSVNVRKMSLDGDGGEDGEDDDRPDDGQLRPAHGDPSKLTFIGEGDAVNLIIKYKLNLCDAPEDFILNSGSLRLLGNLARLTNFNSQIFIIEFGEDIKYPVQTLEDGTISYSQHFGILKQAAKKLGFQAQSSYWMEELDLQRDLNMFATTRSQFKAMRQMLAEHHAELLRKPYTQPQFEALLQSAGRTSVTEVNYEHAEDRISGLVPHAYKMLRLYKELEF